MVLGAPVRELVQRCLTDSDNTVAEYLFLLAGGQDRSTPETSYDQAAASLTQFLERQAGVPSGSWIVSDGSGLSRHNVATPRALCSLLLWAGARPWGAEFVASLPAPGTGTLRNRLAGRALRAKTGTLDLVDALAGLTTRADGKQLAFAVMVNHSSLKSRQIRLLMDRFVERLEE
jgi:D-alanyl-D-alanine carboxypeptidase/D-alanyl-D-alanine-endopeptidase (penicillin-binding protein 4)